MHIQVDSKRLIQGHLPKQGRWDKTLKIIQRKVLKGTHLCITEKELQAAYLKSPYFKDVYLHLVQNKLPPYKAAIGRTEVLLERCLLFFRLDTTLGKELVF